MRSEYNRYGVAAATHRAQLAHRHAMNSGLITDIGKEASVARSGSIHDETMPKFGLPRRGLRRRGHRGRFRPAPAARCDCNLHNARAQFIEGANRVFDRQIDAS
jgi:hypothetical protein